MNIINRKNLRSSSICRELLCDTKLKKIVWVQYADFTEYLEVQGIAYDDISWFYSYLRHMQKAQRFPSQEETFFSYYDDRLFAISRSRYSGEIRIDFTSSFDKLSPWRRIIHSQMEAMELLSTIQVLHNIYSNAACEKMLQVTGCIHA